MQIELKRMHHHRCCRCRHRRRRPLIFRLIQFDSDTERRQSELCVKNMNERFARAHNPTDQDHVIERAYIVS